MYLYQQKQRLMSHKTMSLACMIIKHACFMTLSKELSVFKIPLIKKCILHNIWDALSKSVSYIQ